MSQRTVDAASMAGAKALEWGTEDDARTAIHAGPEVNLPPTFAPLAAVGSIREKAGLNHPLLLSGEANLWPRYSIEVASTGCDPVPEGTL